jgi:hypothetical protein
VSNYSESFSPLKISRINRAKKNKFLFPLKYVMGRSRRVVSMCKEIRHLPLGNNTDLAGFVEEMLKNQRDVCYLTLFGV